MILRMVENKLNLINLHVFTFSFKKKKKQKTLRIPNEYVKISLAGVSAVMVEWELVSFGDTGMEVQHLLGPQPRG